MPGETSAVGSSTRELDLRTRAHDASHFLLTPTRILTPTSRGQVAEILAASTISGHALTFRSGGTSLSGQGQTDQILVDTRRHFRELTVLDDGLRVRVEPGCTIRQVNNHLARHRRRLGPDPASEIACTIGGVIANNSSGMTSGSRYDAYRTLESMVLVLSDGTTIDTAGPGADDRLKRQSPRVHQTLAKLRERVRGDPRIVAEIERQYRLKNTMGYGVNAFLDADRPIDILQKLMIGSEGTLGFVAEATFRTRDIEPLASAGLLVFDSVAGAAAALPALIESGAEVIELMDAGSLRAAQHGTRVPPEIAALALDAQAAYLIEYRADTDETLGRFEAGALALADALGGAITSMTRDEVERRSLWAVRKGIYAQVAEARPRGTTALLEDVAVPPDRLATAIEQLQELFIRFRLGPCPIFGHARDGNIHFMLTIDFTDPDALTAYRRFTDEMVGVILGLGGTLKAEHGTGRVMAPFVERQFGAELYRLMVTVKETLDPARILNPGVLISDAPDAHLTNLKATPRVEAEVDNCVECGYCEPGCPSKDLTMTPRQRIAGRREIAAARMRGDRTLARTMERQYEYDGVQTCAVDGMCRLACPVNIDTGDLTRRLRGQSAAPLERLAWSAAGRHWGSVTRIASTALTIAARLPPALVTRASDVGRALLGADRVPRYTPDLPAGGRPRAAAGLVAGDVVYFPACVHEMFAGAGRPGGVTVAVRSLAEKARVSLVDPPGMAELCCGTPWRSKGIHGGGERRTAAVVDALRAATDNWRRAIVVDASSCTEGLIKSLSSAPGRRQPVVLDALTFAADRLLPRLQVTRRVSSLAVHPTCSTKQLGIDETLRELAEAVADETYIPVEWSCCAFAGDRGMLLPELTASATTAEARELAGHPCERYASSNRTCELGMSRATGQSFEHILEILDEVTRPR